MSWQPEGQPQAFYDSMLPGMYAADFEQHAFYEQQTQLEGRGGIHSDLVFSNSNYQAFNPPGIGHLYNPMFMPTFHPTMQHSPGMPIDYSNSDVVAGSEAGAIGFSRGAESFHDAHRGSGRPAKRGGRQTHQHHYSRGGQRFNEHEYYNNHGYPYQDDRFNSSNHNRREQRRGGYRGSGNMRGRGFHDRSERFASSSGADRSNGNEGASALKQKNNHDLRLEQPQGNPNNFKSRTNSHEVSKWGEETSTRMSNGMREKKGRYNNAGVGSASFYRGSSQVSYESDDKPESVGEKMLSERPGNRPFNRGNLGEEKSSSGNTRRPQKFNHTSAGDNSNSRNNRIDRHVAGFSKSKGVKDVPGSSNKENDESQRASLTEQLSTNKYECMVCCDNVHVTEPIWSCQNCYHVFHLPCIKKWAQSSICQDTRNWRCPGCQNETTYIPSRYFCFCGRRKDPKYVRGETPHSCGEPCRRKRVGNCKHPCTILCHPGPCPPCSSMISVKCDCGKVRKNVRCSASTQFECGQVCNKKLNCMEHSCGLQCHGGACPPCTVSKSQECFCSKTKRTVMCGTEEYAMISFSCEKPCGRTLSCGNHVCEEMCHPGECAPCGLSPNSLQYCCCGKTDVKELDMQERKSCLDPVPTCTKICNKPLSCGPVSQPHLCERTCHNGECGPCNKDTLLRCECGATEKKMPCEVAVNFNARHPFKCQKRCGKKKTCGRHKCSDTCCVRDIHICELVCGRKLTCGVHKCEELCHRGNCKRCLQASFDELTCYCGAEVIEPPVPCGTSRPECHLPCTREHACNHEVRHHCHTEEKCPPCTELTDKLCMGEHMIRRNVPCHLDVVSCGYPCDKKLPCGQHFCQRKCHRGECLEDGQVCTQPCSQLRDACSHPCRAPCHSGKCPDTACKTEITISCPCGNRSAKAQCQAGGDLHTNIAQFQRLSVQTMMESDGQPIDMSQFTQMKKAKRRNHEKSRSLVQLHGGSLALFSHCYPKLNPKRLDCDTNCAIIERNKRLALALEIKNPDMNAKLGNPTFSEFLVEFAKKNVKFAATVEKSLGDLVNAVKQGSQGSKNHTFKSMNRDQRHFVHELAESYGCQTQSFDYEPNKNVVATAFRDKCWLPNITLLDHALKDQMPKKLSSRMGVSLTAMKKEAEIPPEKLSSSRAWETTSWRPTSSSWAASASTSSAGATPASSKPVAPAIDYFDFEG